MIGKSQNETMAVWLGWGTWLSALICLTGLALGAFAWTGDYRAVILGGLAFMVLVSAGRLIVSAVSFARDGRLGFAILAIGAFLMILAGILFKIL